MLNYIPQQDLPTQSKQNNLRDTLSTYRRTNSKTRHQTIGHQGCVCGYRKAVDDLTGIVVDDLTGTEKTML